MNSNHICVLLFDVIVFFFISSSAENIDLSRELEDVQSRFTQTSRLKASLILQVDELKRQVEEENKVQHTQLLPNQTSLKSTTFVLELFDCRPAGS